MYVIDNIIIRGDDWYEMKALEILIHKVNNEES